MQEEVSTMAERPQAKEPAPVPNASRRPELDVMRAFVVAGLVVFHSAVVRERGPSELHRRSFQALCYEELVELEEARS